MGQYVKPDVTVFADASLFHLRGVAGWGGWAKGDGRDSILRGGPMEPHDLIDVLEVCALAEMLGVVMGSEYRRETDRTIMLQSDSTTALSIVWQRIPSAAQRQHPEGASISRRRKSPHPDTAEALDRIERLIGPRAVLLRHVRGHRHGDGRQWVNRRCDEIAKRGALEGVTV